MDRIYIKNLINWKNSPTRKPLMVWGARQVGKSYLIKNIFAEKYYKNNYIYIDCKSDYEFNKFCHEHSSVKEIFNYLSLDNNKIIDKNTLLIFDEVQECLPIITLMKYFCQDYKEIPVIVTGSMVRMKIKRTDKKRGSAIEDKFLFPVGKINQLTIYPLNFEEFLYNKNNLIYRELEASYNSKKEIDETLHNKLLDNLYDYLLIGGMPEVVNEYINTGSYQSCREILKDLYDNYLADMELYQASPEAIIRSKKIFENVYSLLNKESKNFKPSLIEEKSRNRDMINPIDWLTTSHLVYKSLLIKEKVSLPLIEDNESLYRLYLSDMGLFTYESKINPKSFLSNDSRNTLSGIFFENYVAIELNKYGYKLFYWKGKNDAEFEFLIEDDNDIIPIDVKKSKGSLNSLNKFKNHNKLKYALKISTSKYGFDENNKVLNIPFYYLPFFLKELNEKNKLK